MRRKKRKIAILGTVGNVGRLHSMRRPAATARRDTQEKPVAGLPGPAIVVGSLQTPQNSRPKFRAGCSLATPLIRAGEALQKV